MATRKPLLACLLSVLVSALALHPALSIEPPTPAVKPDAPIVVKAGSLIEIMAEASASWLVIEPADLEFRLYDSGKVFVCAGVSKTGFVRVVSATNGDASGTPKVKLSVFSVEPPPAPAPVILPTAKLTAEPTNVKPGESTTLTWVTTGAEKVTLQGEPVDAAGTVLVQPSLPTNLFTLAAESSAGIVYSQTIVTVSDLPPPIPNPTPITEKGFRVLIVEETEDRINLPKGQLEILLSLADGGVRKFLETKCVKDAKGNPEFRILDKDNDLSRDSKVWQDAWKIPHTPLPYLIATNGVTGFAGPLPKTPDETIAILQRIAGP